VGHRPLGNDNLEQENNTVAMEVSFPSGKKVAADWIGFTIMTDQTVKEGGDGSAPSPFDLFLASLATCAAYYVLEFCEKRNLPTDQVRLTQDWERDKKTGLISTIEQKVFVPADFPEKYEAALVRAALLCSVKKHLEKAPEVVVETVRG